MSRTALIEALAAGRPDGLTGVAETSWLDFKAAPYKLDTDKAKFELCKDVAAFANAQGGLLVLGVKAKKQPDRAQEIAAALHPFPQEEVDVGRYYDTINEYLRPRVSVTHHWYRDPARSTAAELHYLVIEIEPVAERDRWVIVRRTLNDREKFADGLAVPQRHGDRTVFLPAEDVYQLINEGVRARDRVPAAPIPPLGGLADEAEESLNTLQKLQDWDNIPVLFWQSIPPERVGVLPGLHERDGIQGSLSRQDVLRQSGFNFADTFGRLRLHEGGLMLNRTRVALWVRPDGLTTAGAVATPELLCWAMEQRGRPQRLNTYVLTELTLEYFRLADELVVPRVPGAWRHRIVARRFAGAEPRVLGPGGTYTSPFLSEATPASADTWDQSWTAVNDPERDAFEALRLIYALFGVDVASNPDVEDNRVPAQRFREAG